MTLTEISDSLFRHPIELAARSVALDLFVESRAIERLEPFAEPSEFIRRKSGDGLFDIVKLGHARQHSMPTLGWRRPGEDRERP
jgi:hypothetical protein